MKWPLIIAIIWYWWRLYSLPSIQISSPIEHMRTAYGIIRANRSFFLGAGILTALLYALGVIHSWWAITLSFIASFVVVMFAQVSLVGAVILHEITFGYAQTQNRA